MEEEYQQREEEPESKEQGEEDRSKKPQEIRTTGLDDHQAVCHCITFASNGSLKPVTPCRKAFTQTEGKDEQNRSIPSVDDQVYRFV
jgi:hypothetical protein